VFTARYALSSYIKQIRFVFKGLTVLVTSTMKIHRRSSIILISTKYSQRQRSHCSHIMLYSPIRDTPKPRIHLLFTEWDISEKIETAIPTEPNIYVTEVYRSHPLVLFFTITNNLYSCIACICNHKHHLYTPADPFEYNHPILQATYTLQVFH
jgi:hypothetical protein